MLQIEEWFRRPQRRIDKDKREKPERPAFAEEKPPQPRPASHVTAEAAPQEQAAGEFAFSQQLSEQPDALQAGAAEELQQPQTTEAAYRTGQPQTAEAAYRTEQPQTAEAAYRTEQPQTIEPEHEPESARMADEARGAVSLADSIAETDEIDQITEKIGLDVSDMIDLEKEDFLLRQIDEFREKAKQLQQLMETRKKEAKQLQSTLSEKEEQASKLDDLITVRQDEADKIMGNVSERIDAMSKDVRREMSGLSDTVSQEVSGLTQNLTREINLSTENTRQVVENVAQNMIDQNTRSLEGLKEQLEQLGQLEQINELSTEMNSQITTLKTDLADKIHAEDVKCYRNIQASMNEQNKLISDADEKTRQHIQEQVDNLQERMGSQSKLMKVSLFFSVLNFLGIIGVLACLFFL